MVSKFDHTYENLTESPRVKSREVWPFYIVCDISASMHEESFRESWGSEASPWALMNTSLQEIYTNLCKDEQASVLAHLCVVEFAGTAKTTRPLLALDNGKVPPFSKGTWTNYVDVWKLLSNQIPADLEQLRNAGHKARRSTIFMITDGNPGADQIMQREQDWKPYIDALYSKVDDKNRKPRIVAVGLGACNESVLYGLHSRKPHGVAVTANRVDQVGVLVQAVIKQIKNSIINSTQSGSFVWRTPHGMRSLCNATCVGRPSQSK